MQDRLSTRLSRQNVSFSNELGIRSKELASLICYPRFSEIEYNDRLAEMESLGVSSIMLGGMTTINGLHVAGKGQVGLVLRAKIGNKICALKIRRMDANRKTMDDEASLHRLANDAGVGPRFVAHNKDMIAMEFIDGLSVVDWVQSAGKAELRDMAKSVLEQCYRLDNILLDHGELSRLNRHVIVSDKPYIIDFESASKIRKTSNVTAAAQSIFLFGAVAAIVIKSFQVNKENVLLALKIYKRSQTRTNFDAVLNSLQV